jgi:hypothetical protein
MLRRQDCLCLRSCQRVGLGHYNDGFMCSKSLFLVYAVAVRLSCSSQRHMTAGIQWLECSRDRMSVQQQSKREPQHSHHQQLQNVIGIACDALTSSSVIVQGTKSNLGQNEAGLMPASAPQEHRSIVSKSRIQQSETLCLMWAGWRCPGGLCGGSNLLLKMGARRGASSGGRVSHGELNLQFWL